MGNANTLRVRLFVPSSFEGVASVAVLEEIIDKDIDLEVVYTGNLDFRDWQKFTDTEIVVCLGTPYKGYALPDDFYIVADNPFTDFIHIATYGHEIQPGNGGWIVSTVNEDKDPIKELLDLLYSELPILAKHVTITDKAKQMVEAINAYRTWTWETNGTTRLLLALYHAGYKRLPKLLRGLSLPDIVKEYAPIIKGQFEKMNDYIERKRDMVKTRTISIDGESCVLKVVYAEEYINELANDILSRDQTPQPVIVCVGRTTKSSDILSIRTRGVQAGKIAYFINGGGGKDQVASVFTGMSYAELIGNAAASKLSQLN